MTRNTTYQTQKNDPRSYYDKRKDSRNRSRRELLFWAEGVVNFRKGVEGSLIRVIRGRVRRWDDQVEQRNYQRGVDGSSYNE